MGTLSGNGPAREDWRERERRVQETRAAVRGMRREPAGKVPLACLVLASVIWLATVAWLALVLPDRVPSHWTSGPLPDQWSDKARYLLTTVLLPLLLLYPMILLSRLAIVWPDGVNVPNKEWWLATPARLNRFERLLREDLMVFTSATLLFVAALNVESGMAAQRTDGARDPSVSNIALVVYLLVVIGWCVRMVATRYSPSEADDLA